MNTEPWFGDGKVACMGPVGMAATCDNCHVNDKLNDEMMVTYCALAVIRYILYYIFIVYLCIDVYIFCVIFRKARHHWSIY